MLDAHTLMAQLHRHPARRHRRRSRRRPCTAPPEPELEYAEADFRNDSGILTPYRQAPDALHPDCGPSRQSPSSAWTSLHRNLLQHPRRRIPARISTRLAPGDNPKRHRALAEHIKAHAPHGAQANYTPVDSGMPFATEVDADGAQTALDAMRAAWDVEPVQTGMGGSIPFISDLKGHLPAGTNPRHRREDPDTRAHSANESPPHPDFKNAISRRHTAQRTRRPAKRAR